VLDGSLYGGAFPLTGGADTLSLPTANLQAGAHVLDVFYSGDSEFASTYGAPVNLAVAAPGAAQSVVAIANLPATVAIGSTPSFTANVAPLSPAAGSPAPTGVLEVSYDNGPPSAPILLTGASTRLAIPGNLALGTHTISAFYSGDNTYDFATSPAQDFLVVVPNFTMSPATFSATVSNLSGGPSVYPLTLTPNTAFSFPVSFKCAGLPANTACTFSPATLTFSGSSVLATTLQIDLDTGVTGLNASRANRRATPAAELACLFCLALPLGFATRRAKRARLASLLFLLGLVTALNGCGSGYKDFAGMTPTGTYAIAITATSPYETHTSTLTLTVQQ
jgi:hypothetical protein